MSSGRPSEGKISVNLTLTPAFIAEARELDPNLSRFVEYAGKKEILRAKRAKRKGPDYGPDAA